ncbi:DJ-1 family glyoxalase III [Clostridium chauvoei]|uniref:DJ-1/PfpI family protein n=2 Tax=Clostridium chauvoei TaxID=46867 RepID=A0ABD4RIP9_9CLOT|nr:DJ-1 family glyoxalase III [Clostridium chauvoei]ATD54593.1 DJ-1 family protein [Clostridium chauvoei]ATD57726.1 DJ-1 family protein [Clostridium chauvoei]MBX7281004.1 DJ-1/PfpI family protein [Clostridium chauvoei]MBX7283494.1 DJ-1/PfpI family protein [Clostridium chauvoei]MBX7286093.1 DJ-1/PfpI family protein [Clostridium chauvoei]
MKKVAILLADGFETIEALTVVDVLRRADVTCNTFALKDLEVTTSHKVKVIADNNIENNEINEYDILVLPGGIPGSTSLRDNKKVISLIKEFYKKGKFVCAICAAPIALGKAGITTGKNITCYPGFETELGECNYKNELVVVDNNIITGRGPAAAIPFAFEILSKVKPEKVDEIKRGMLFI